MGLNILYVQIASVRIVFATVSIYLWNIHSPSPPSPLNTISVLVGGDGEYSELIGMAVRTLLVHICIYTYVNNVGHHFTFLFTSTSSVSPFLGYERMKTQYSDVCLSTHHLYVVYSNGRISDDDRNEIRFDNVFYH